MSPHQLTLLRLTPHPTLKPNRIINVNNNDDKGVYMKQIKININLTDDMYTYLADEAARIFGTTIEHDFEQHMVDYLLDHFDDLEDCVSVDCE